VPDLEALRAEFTTPASSTSAPVITIPSPDPAVYDVLLTDPATTLIEDVP
jgi:hypothetical protein